MLSFGYDGGWIGAALSLVMRVPLPFPSPGPMMAMRWTKERGKISQGFFSRASSARQDQHSRSTQASLSTTNKREHGPRHNHLCGPGPRRGWQTTWRSCSWAMLCVMLASSAAPSTASPGHLAVVAFRGSREAPSPPCVDLTRASRACGVWMAGALEAGDWGSEVKARRKRQKALY